MGTTASTSDEALLKAALEALDEFCTPTDWSELREDIRDRLGPFRLIREGSGHSYVADRDPYGAARYAEARGLKLITEYWTDRNGDVGTLHYWVQK